MRMELSRTIVADKLLARAVVGPRHARLAAVADPRVREVRACALGLPVSARVTDV